MAIETRTLKQRVFQAGTWTLASHAISQAIRLASNLLMTRLMVPEMFGIMAISTTLIVGLSLFSDIGLRQSIIQSARGEEELFLNTAWSVQIVRGAVIALAGILISCVLLLAQLKGLIAYNNVYNEPTLPYVLAALSASMFVAGFESTKLVTASRRLELGRIAFLEISQQLVAVLVMIGWALVVRSIWALVAGAVLSNLYRVFAGYFLFPGTNNRWCWDKSCYQEIIGLGRWVFLSSVLTFILANGDRLLLGGIVSAEMLGVYSIAYLIINAIEMGVRKLIANVCYAAITEVVRENPGNSAALKNIYYRFLQPVDVILYSVTGLLYVAGGALIQFLYDSRYQDAGWILPIMCFSLLAIRFDLASACYLALGRPKISPVIVGARLIGLYGFVPIAFFIWGFRGALWVLSLNFLCCVPLIYYVNIKFGIVDLKREFLTVPAIIFGGLAGWLLSTALPLIHHVRH